MEFIHVKSELNFFFNQGAFLGSPPAYFLYLGNKGVLSGLQASFAHLNEDSAPQEALNAVIRLHDQQHSQYDQIAVIPRLWSIGVHTLIQTSCIVEPSMALQQLR